MSLVVDTDEYPTVVCSVCSAAPGTPCMEVVDDGRIAAVPCHGPRRMVALVRAAYIAAVRAVDAAEADKLDAMLAEIAALVPKAKA